MRTAGARIACCTCLILTALDVPRALAQMRGDERLPEIVVSAENPAAGGGSLTVPGVEKQREQVLQTVGSVGFIDAESYKQRFSNTLYDVLKYEPGVFVQPRYGQEQRISIRGSGTARGFHLRGIELLQDAVPVNLADGSGDNYQLDPLAFRAVEIYKGGNALTYGASTLGGAINFVTPTAHTAIAPNVLRLDGGSFGTVRLNAQVSRVLGDADFLVNGTVTHSDGFRQHARQQAEQFNANVGWRLGPNAETRFYFGAYIVDQQLPGTLSLSDALNNPRKAAPTALSGDQARNSRTERIANVTSFRLEVGQLDIASWAIHKNLYHPIFQVIDQDGWTYGVAPRYTADFEIGGFRDQVIAGARFIGGNNTALQFVNIGGARGAKTVDSAQNAYNYEAYAENRFFFLPTVALMTGAKFLHDERVFEDNGGTPGHSALIASRNYDGINPKLGLLWVPRPDIQVFADVTRSLDVPDFSDLVQSSFSTTRFVPLQAQRAWTAEVGTRGRYDRFAWNITLFRSLVRDELMQFTLAPGIPANTFNAPRTLHQGIEFGGSVDLLRGLFAADDTIKLTQVWNYSDFRFENDPVFGNNRLAAIPQHVLRTVIHYAHPSGFYFAPTLDWVPRGPWADYANTLRVPAYALLGLQTGVQFSNGLLLFAEARNLTDKRYVSDLSTIANAAAPGANTAIFYPGDGRSVYAGARYAF